MITKAIILISIILIIHLSRLLYSTMLNKNTLGVKKVRGQSEAALQIRRYVRPKTLISVEAKKFTYQKSDLLE